MPDLYDTATLLEVINAPALAPGLEGFWLKFFPRQITFDGPRILFDQIDQNEYRLAPFVAPNVQGRVMRAKGFDTVSFTPAYVKPKHVVDPSRALPRMAGEALTGGLSQQQRWDAIVADNLRRERLVIENRWDWMACRALVDGAVTVAGEDYPSVTVDFKRDASLTSVLSGTAKWDNAAATPIANIAAMRQQGFRLSRSPINTVIFGLDAWAAFNLPTHEDVKELLDRQRLNNNSNFTPANLGDGSPYEYVGYLQGGPGGGRIDMYTYSNQWEDFDGTMRDYIDPGTVIGLGGAIGGARCFGAIQDKRAGFVSLPIFPKMYDTEDPSVTYTLSQSAPLMVPVRPNNTFSMKVV